jgi:hypothetical protein
MFPALHLDDGNGMKMDRTEKYNTKGITIGITGKHRWET